MPKISIVSLTLAVLPWYGPHSETDTNQAPLENLSTRCADLSRNSQRGIFIEVANMRTRQCTTCKETKSFSDFSNNIRNREGKCTRCKSCDVIATKAYRSRPEVKAARQARLSKYRKTDRHKETVAVYEKKRSAWRKTEEGRAVRRNRLKEYRLANKEKDRARVEVARNVKAGKMSRVTSLQCERCGKQAQEYHHHKGYDKCNWLDVIPLCCECHKECHVEMGRA